MNTELTDKTGICSRCGAPQGLETQQPGNLPPAGLRAGKEGVLDWGPLLIMPAASLCFRNTVQAWEFMWIMALSIFLGCKWMTWRHALNVKPSAVRSLMYLIAWPGMDARTFLEKNAAVEKTAPFSFLKKASCSLLNTLVGALCLFYSERIITVWPLPAGWLAMCGIVLVLHFGLFEMLALAWQSCGIKAQPLMSQPLLAVSLKEFWSRRWNTAFNELVHSLTLRPLSRRFGMMGGIIGVFLISGLVHEAVISLPARAGYGLPTAYFLLQGVGVLFERSAAGRRLGLGRGIRGRLFMGLFTAGPAFWLFHPGFVSNVILPMINTLKK